MEKTLKSAKTEYYFTQRLFTPGILMLTEERLKWHKDFEFFMLTLVRRMMFPDYSKDFSIDVAISDIESMTEDPESRRRDVLLVTLKDKKVLKFICWDGVDEWIALFEKQRQHPSGSVEN